MWVTGSRAFRDVDDYLLAGVDFSGMKDAGKLPLVTADGSARYLEDRLALLQERLKEVNGLAARPGKRHVPGIRITDLLMEVDTCTGFTDRFTSLISGHPSKDK